MPTVDKTVDAHQRRTGRAGVGLAMAASLIIAACGGSDSPSAATTATTVATETTDGQATTVPATAPPTTEAPSTSSPATTPETAPTTTAPATGSVVITSADGNLTIKVGADDAERVNPSVRILDPSEWPPELGDADQLPGVTIYELEPDGAQFDEPVTVTRRLDVASFGEAVGLSSVPLVVPFTQDDDGRFVPLDDLEVTRFGSALFASGTTTHFSPLGTLDLGMDVQFPGFAEPGPAAPGLDTEFYLDLASSYEFNDNLPIDAGVADILGGETPEVVSRQANPPDGFPLFRPVVVEEVERTSPRQSSEEDAASLYRMLTSSDDVPSSRLFADEGVDVPQDLRVAVSNYLVATYSSVDDAEVDRLKEIADAIAAGACLEWSVFHTPIGGYPSYSRSKLTKFPELEDGEELIAALYTGDLGPTATLIDLVTMERDGDGYGADVGLQSYGDVNQAFIVTTNGSAPDEGASDRERWESFLSLPGDLLMIFLDEPFAVDANEGVLFDGEVEFQIYDGP